MFDGRPVELPSGGRHARVATLFYELKNALRTFMSDGEAAELIERMRCVGQPVESGEFQRPDGIFTMYDGRRIDLYPPGTYVVRETRDGCGVIWRLEERDAGA
jgi:hypothetical protein